MTKAEVIARLCGLSSRVMNVKFSADIPADCFCSEGRYGPIGNYQFDEQIVEFIEHAVNAALDADEAA